MFEPLEISVHFLRRSQVEFVALHLHTRLIGSEFPHVDTQHHVLGFGVFAVDVVAIAGRHQRQSDAVGDFDGTLQLGALDINAVVHDLNEVTFAEEIVKPARDIFGFF